MPSLQFAYIAEKFGMNKKKSCGVLLAGLRIRAHTYITSVELWDAWMIVDRKTPLYSSPYFSKPAPISPPKAHCHPRLPYPLSSPINSSLHQPLRLPPSSSCSIIPYPSILSPRDHGTAASTGSVLTAHSRQDIISCTQGHKKGKWNEPDAYSKI